MSRIAAVPRCRAALGDASDPVNPLKTRAIAAAIG